MKTFCILCIFVLIAAGAEHYFFDNKSGARFLRGDNADQSRPTVSIPGKQEPVEVYIADTPALHQKGLSGKEALGENEGMLFIFSEPQIPSFWMKDMLFNIDIIWLSEEWQVVDIHEGLTPESYPQTVTPSQESMYVLEVPAGFVKKNMIKKGQILFFKK